MTTHQNAEAEITRYINDQQEWAKSICNKLRNMILAADKKIIEDWKWGPHYKTAKGMVCGFSAFQKHAKLTFFNGSQLKDKEGLFNHCIDNEFSRSIKFTDAKEINETVLTKYIKEAVAVNERGFKRVTKKEDKTIEIPVELAAAFKRSESAKAFFEKIPYSHKKEYVEWILSAKREETRKARIEKAIAMMEQKTGLNDKYRKL
jgi:uncharacterized protein YdeI (YjbR/CyaY-like superfamily)